MSEEEAIDTLRRAIHQGLIFESLGREEMIVLLLLKQYDTLKSIQETLSSINAYVSNISVNSDNGK